MPESMNLPDFQSRRRFLHQTGSGFAGVALGALLAGDTRASGPSTANDSATTLSDRPPHRPGRAKQVIFLSMYGGPSTFELLDYKPDLAGLDGKPVPDSIKSHPNQVLALKQCKDEILGDHLKWARHGESGQWVSELLPHTAQYIDELCQVRSMVSESANHAPATYLMNTGAILGGRPSLGSWTTYGLGSLNQNLPGYVLLYKVGGLGGSANWSNGFLPATYQGTQFRHEGTPVLNLQPPAKYVDGQRAMLDFAQTLNRRHAAAHPGVLDLEGRIASYELAYRMQSEALDIGELSLETKTTQDAYGLHDENHDKAVFGRMCLLSRRLIEKGVRFVQLYNAVDKLGWDGHDDNAENHRRNALQTDQPIAALLGDLKQRGLLDSTLVVWAGEFGRTAMIQGEKKGRNHNPNGFTIWMAGGGVNGGKAIGATDEIGLRAVEEPQPVKNLHATIFTALGIDPDELFFEYNGRQERLTGVAKSWRVIPGVLES